MIKTIFEHIHQMKIAEILSSLESIAPLAYQESYDNAGLLTGDPQWDCTGILCTLDAIEDVVSEAISKKCNLVITHHPIIFRGLKKITGKNYVERAIIRAIKNDIALYAIHTNLDNILDGVNGKMADKLGLLNRTILAPKEATLRKLFTFVPVGHLDFVQKAIFDAGAGNIGNYSECSFTVEGMGTFRGNENTDPFVGEPGKRHYEKEVKLEVIFPSYLQQQIIQALNHAHPYEEVAYDVVELSNAYPMVGSGLIGELPEPMEEKQFLELTKRAFRLQMLRHTRFISRPIKSVALCGGAGSFLIPRALSKKADVFLTADLKYHELFDAEGLMLLCDIGHFESEQYTIDLLTEILHVKFPTFAVLKSEVQTNPVHYYF